MSEDGGISTDSARVLCSGTIQSGAGSAEARPATCRASWTSRISPIPDGGGGRGGSGDAGARAIRVRWPRVAGWLLGPAASIPSHMPCPRRPGRKMSTAPSVPSPRRIASACTRNTSAAMNWRMGGSNLGSSRRTLNDRAAPYPSVLACGCVGSLSSEEGVVAGYSSPPLGVGSSVTRASPVTEGVSSRVLRETEASGGLAAGVGEGAGDGVRLGVGGGELAGRRGAATYAAALGR